MDIKLNKLVISNFKGIKSFTADFDGENATIKGVNGSGKTTVYDAFLWLLFGKDSTGRKDFDLRPLDKDNQPIKGLELAVEGVLSINGTSHTYRKEHHENNVKGQLKGYETLCYIDEVPKLVGEYADYIAEIIPEDVFKMLTNIRHFSAGLEWKERRAMLLDIAGKIGTPEGFDKLLAVLNGRTVDEYKQVLAGQKKQLTKDRDEINPRIDEIQRGLDSYAGTDTSNLETSRKEIKSALNVLQVKRNSLAIDERNRNENIAKLNELKGLKIECEAALKADTSGVKILLDEKTDITNKIHAHSQKVCEAGNDVKLKRMQIKDVQAELEQYLAILNTVRADYTKAREVPGESNCFACGQKLPADKLTENEKAKQARLAEIKERGDKLFQSETVCKATITALEAELKALQTNLDMLNARTVEAETWKTKRFEEIDKAIASNPSKPPQQDSTWQSICKEIVKAEELIGAPVSKQIELIDTQSLEKSNQLAELDKALAQVDRMKKDKVRIGELGAEEKKLSQQIADVESGLSGIEQYQAAISELIESAVNGKFKYVKFKLFERLLNGSIEPCCDSMLNGVPYSDMSYGQKVIVGIDIINVLSAHYGYSVPLFIDNAESLTLPIEAESQTVKLYATEVAGLKFSKEEKQQAKTESEPSIFDKPKTTATKSNKKTKKE